jgi:zinc transport system permease protein
MSWLDAIPFFRDTAVNPFLATGLAAALLASLACGLVGPYVISRRIVFLSGAVAHIAVGGIGAAVFLSRSYPRQFGGLSPLAGGIVAALVSAVVLSIMHRRSGERIDTLIGALWALGMSVGILLAKLTPGYQTELLGYLFGNLVYVSPESVRLLAVLDVVVVVAVVLFHKRLLAVILDEQQARLQGVSVLATEMLLLTLVALTVISLAQVVGLILVIALLSLPAAAAGHHVTRLPSMMAWATVLCVLLTTLPRIAVYGTPISPEPAIVVAAVGLYLLSLALRSRRRRRRPEAHSAATAPAGGGAEPPA